ncbi:hypothetical protein ATANTOWER_022382 [Ataeniobius toweri]|uniref:Uncharacterized protein n=1 Tax=Ataeniobius toweri TaxID=208326 RepID=A0ABU7BJ17_9TELE|nr:hypothetical protein [Ataeniobius toweri]
MPSSSSAGASSDQDPHGHEDGECNGRIWRKTMKRRALMERCGDDMEIGCVIKRKCGAAEAEGKRGAEGKRLINTGADQRYTETPGRI